MRLFHQRWLPAILLSVVLAPGGSLLAKKKPKPARQQASQKTPAPPRMTPDEAAIHVLNRLSFGPRPGDVEQVKSMGVERWIEQQLHPADIAQNPVLEAKLAPLDTLTMPTVEMVRHYPTPQMIRLMLDGKLPFPDDPVSRRMIEKFVGRFQRKEAAGKAGLGDDADVSAKAISGAWQLDEEQKRILGSGTPAEQAALIAAMPPAEQTDVLDTLPDGTLRKLYNAAPNNDLRRKVQSFTGPLQVVNQDLIEGRLFRAVYSSRQLEEVLADFWFNHFNVNLDKGADRYMVTTYERDVIRPHVLGHFKDLLLATAESPAMLFYLDNWESVGPTAKRRSGLNENYGRELMELHTLGVDGGYTQQDVTEVARCFTGWTIKDPREGGGFFFNPKNHDDGEKHVLGVTIAAGGGINDGLKVLDILEHHPATARFISRKLATRFVSDDPPAALVERMARRFTETDGDITEVLRTMFNSAEFWDPAVFRAKIKSPLELIASAVRAVNGDVDYAFGLAGLMNQFGEPLYRKVEPTGYSNRGAEWMNSASLIARMNFGMALARGNVPGVKVDTTQFSLDASRVERAILQTEPSEAARTAIQTGLDQQAFGAMAAGLTLGSPDFQRR